MTLEKDLRYGFQKEDELFNIIKKLDPNIIKTDDWSHIDYESDNSVIELKSRRINHNQYETALINYCKIEYMLNSNKKSYIVYNYLDGIFYCEVNKEFLNKCHYNPNYHLHRENKTSKVLEIPYELLQIL